MKKITTYLLIFIIYLSYAYINTYKGEDIFSKNIYVIQEKVYIKNINNKLLIKKYYENNIYEITNNGNYTVYFNEYGEYIGYSGSKFNYLRNIIDNRCKKVFPYELYSYAKALLLYDKSDIDDTMLEIIKKVGIAHIFSLSGFHLMLIYMIIISILFFLSKKIKIIVAMTLISIYVFIIGDTPSIIRSYIMLLIINILDIYNIKYSKKKILLFVFLLTSILNPYNILNISYILTYLVYFVIVVYKDKNIIEKNIMIQVFTMPIILFIFKSYNIISFLVNILLIPVFTMFIYLILLNLLLNIELITIFLLDYLQIIKKILIFISKIDFIYIQYTDFNFTLLIGLYIVAIIYLTRKQHLTIKA